MKIESIKSELNIYPSFYVRRTERYLSWCSITVCKQCGLTGKYEDQHPVDPCMNCGTEDPQEMVGRWIFDKRPWWKFWQEKTGYWEIKK